MWLCLCVWVYVQESRAAFGRRLALGRAALRVNIALVNRLEVLLTGIARRGAARTKTARRIRIQKAEQSAWVR